MPVQYESVLAEHRAVREEVGIFDVTHLGRFELNGPGARDALRSLLCNDIDRIEPGRTQYSMMLNDGGGVIDDLIVWWWEEGLFWVLPNAANHDRVMARFVAQPGCAVSDLRQTTVLLAVQGPHAPELIQQILGSAPARFRTRRADWHGAEISMAGTGYTGERGGEICAPMEVAARLFEEFVHGGAKPCGLGARDTLRLEAGLPLWGEDIDESATPVEAGLGFAVSLDHDFTGKETVERQFSEGPPRKLVGFALEERGVPRHGYPVRTANGGTGSVTSGNMSPLLGRGIGLAYVAPPPVESEIEIEIRAKWVPGRIVAPPFHKNA